MDYELTLNDYQRDNLLSALERIRSGDRTSAKSLNTGDWVVEVMSLLGFAGDATDWGVFVNAVHDADESRAERILRAVPNEHTIRVTDHDWVISHPLSCRFSDHGLHGCPFTAEAATITPAEWAAVPKGTFPVTLDDDGEFNFEMGPVAEPTVEPWMGKWLDTILSVEHPGVHDPDRVDDPRGGEKTD